MRYAIIAAGEGSRLAQEGITVPKPLVKVNGETLIGRLLRIFSANNAEDIVIITRAPLQIPHEEVNVPVKHLVKATPSSMHSFYEMASYLDGGPFIMTTVDTYFDENQFSEYVHYFEKAVSDGYDGVMAVTDYIEDEKPLYVATELESNHEITGFLDSDPGHRCHYISAGIYGLTPKALQTLRRCMAEGQSRMRNFQRGLIADGLRLLAFPLGKVIDIDHVSDICRIEN